MPCISRLLGPPGLAAGIAVVAAVVAVVAAVAAAFCFVVQHTVVVDAVNFDCYCCCWCCYCRG